MIYQSVERTVEVLVAIVTIGLILVAIAVGSMETWQKLGSGLINVGYIDPGMSVKKLFSALVFAGAGGTANLFYTFYLRIKTLVWERSCRGYRTRFEVGAKRCLRRGFSLK